MNIIEATKKALEEGKWITRRGEDFCGCKVKPTNTRDCFLLAVIDEPERPPAKHWNPDAADILADDYEVID